MLVPSMLEFFAETFLPILIVLLSFYLHSYLLPSFSIFLLFSIQFFPPFFSFLLFSLSLTSFFFIILFSILSVLFFSIILYSITYVPFECLLMDGNTVCLIESALLNYWQCLSFLDSSPVALGIFFLSSRSLKLDLFDGCIDTSSFPLASRFSFQ